MRAQTSGAAKAPAEFEPGGGLTMATEKLDIATLNAISVRLGDHADKITNAARQDANDLRLAARIADRLASLRFRVGEIAGKAIEHPGWNNAAIARDLDAALDDALSDAEGR
jgi:hypothetical protein